MSALTLLGSSTFNTTSGSKGVTATPAVGDLPVIIAAHTGNTSTAAPTDNNADGLGTYSLINTAVKASSADTMKAWVRDAPIGSATSTTFTSNPGTSSGGGLAVIKATGMSRKSVAAILQSAIQSNQASGGTPTPVLGAAAQTYNALIAAVFNATNPATMTPRGTPAWTERVDVGYNTPTTGLEVMTIDSGETGTSIAWGSTSGSAFASIVIELDTANKATVSQSVPDASLSATAKAVDSLSSTQSLPDVSQYVSIETYQHTVNPRPRHQLYITGTSRRIAFSSQGAGGSVISLSASQSLQDATLSATAKAIDSLSASQNVADATLTVQVAVTAKASSTQSLPDALLSANIGAVAGLALTQSVPDASLTATAKAVTGLSVSQSVVDASLSATAGLVAKLSSTQSVPDAALSFIVSGQGGLQLHENVPHATLTATAQAIDSLSASQSLPDVSLSATALAVVKLSLSQSVQDATLSASITHTNSVSPRKRYFILSRTSRRLNFTSLAGNFRSLSVTQAIPDAALSASAKAVDSLSSSQSVADASLSASAKALVSASVAQSLPDASLVAAVITNLTLIKGAFHRYQTPAGSAILAWRGPEFIPPAASITVNQSVPDASLVASAAVIGKLTGAQSLADAALSAAAAVILKASATQSVPDASLVASSKALAGLNLSQAVVAPSQSANAQAIDSASVNQSVPDAALLAVVNANTSVAHLLANQAVPDASLVALAITTNPIRVNQLVPDASLVALINAVVSARSTQLVPDVVQVATGLAIAGLSSSQLVDAPDLLAQMFTSNRTLQADQNLPDAAMNAQVTTKRWGKPTNVEFSFASKLSISFTE